MTTIILDRKNKCIYSDSQTTYDDNHINKFKKVKKVNGIIYAVSCDNYNDIIPLVEYIEGIGPKPKKTPKSNFDIVTIDKKGNAFTYNGQIMPEEIILDYYTAGSGGYIIDIILEYQKKFENKIDIKKAIKIAIDKDLFSSGPIQKMWFK